MIIPATAAQITLTFAGPALPHGAALVFGVENVGPQTAAQLAFNAGDAFADEFMGVLSNGITLIRSRAKRGPNASGQVAEVGFSVVGSIATEGEPPNLAFLIRKVTNFGGRSQRGRMYLPGVVVADVGSDGVITPAKLTTLQTRANQFLARLDTDGNGMVLLHNASSDPTNVEQLVVQSTAATQRRRLRR